MARFKKSEIYKVNVDELVNTDGNEINRATPPTNRSTVYSTDNTGDIPKDIPLDFDTHVKNAGQKRQFPYGFNISPLRKNRSIGTLGGASVDPLGYTNEDEELSESELSMIKMLEDIFTTHKDGGMVKPDINHNQIPDDEEIGDDQDISSKIRQLIDAVNGNQLGDEERTLVIRTIAKEILSRQSNE